MTFSSILAIGDKRAIGLYEVPIFGSLLGFGIVTILASFHCFGIVFVLSAVLYMCVRNSMARGPRCFMCLMFMLSGPVELFVLDLFMAVFVWSVVIWIGIVCRFFIFLSMILFCLFVLCFMWFVNCLLKFSAFCLSVMAIMLLNVMVVFVGGFCFLLESLEIVFQSLCESCLWLQTSVMCSFQSSCLCF